MKHPVIRSAWPVACAVLLAACGGDRTVQAAQASTAARATPPAPVPESASDGIDAAPAVDPAIAIRVPEGLDRYPALDAAVRTRNDAHRQAFAEARDAARQAGADASHWRLRIDWRGIAGNRYLRLMQGDGRMDAGSGEATTIAERVTYEGIGKRVLAFGDWFADDAAAAAAVRDIVAAEAPGAAAIDLSSVAYEPVFSADGPVMGFDLLLPPTAPGADGPRRVRVPLAAVEASIDPAQRQALSAEAAGP